MLIRPTELLQSIEFSPFVGRIRRLRRIRQETPDKICPLSIYLILQLNPSAQANLTIINYAFLLIR
ncbi:hypothetical protein CXP54_11305 [Escherichia albertii]|nr:hypothetical protein CXP54_11305 [Escherichia albertii]EAB1452186.1 hypothetical protein [Escherichia albertii]EEW7339909.1 hypothetical protein [Escherichia albertii]EEW7496175.1 hypothetical protein [Escherichia albertii]EFO0108330.1 hypothetical protein [Escherichia albertii]